MVHQGDEAYNAHLKDCGNYDYDGFLYIDPDTPHFYALGAPGKDAVAAGCPFVATHAVLHDDEDRAKEDASKEILLWKTKEEAESMFADEDKLKSRILTELAQNDDGYLPLDDICQDVEDRDVITQSIESLASEGKIMMDEDENGTMAVFPISD